MCENIKFVKISTKSCLSELVTVQFLAEPNVNLLCQKSQICEPAPLHQRYRIYRSPAVHVRAKELIQTRESSQKGGV
jgi:hypothetical protein